MLLPVDNTVTFSSYCCNENISDFKIQCKTCILKHNAPKNGNRSLGETHY